MTATPHAGCPACLLVEQLTEHRDQAAVEPSERRTTLSFAIVLARWACPAYVPISQRPEDPTGNANTTTPEAPA